MYAASRRGWVAFLGSVLGLAMGQVQAASSVLIWPIDPVLEADQQASALWLENRGTETANLQIRVFAWSQSGFDEQYQNQRDVIGSPPVAKIEPGQKQLVRLTRTKDVPPGREMAYRIIIDEIPSAVPVATPEDGKTAAAVRFQMRYSVPLFAYGPGLWSKVDDTRERDPKSAGKPDLSWKKITVAGRNYVEMHNQGAVHARLTDASFKQGGQSRPLVEGLMGYVLPGATMRWQVPDNLPADQPLQVRVNGATQLENLAPGR
ncbi:fimbria/pilus periplasmic chaperone [Pseudomonas syringae]|uniref:Fimbria/pilus periplasmic chaperone n=1 Tax=Pseudomonas syringae TaxID=317 RepID=A0A9Q3ZYV4_PSESX|nr:fimbria/pilus periplasmic chaperone [Pseudomonas syringae]MCF5065681.1 fimbria/pilus periplasmic chaperone [Pseudomonas syringae]MCF5075881.1 fimbria/pilus periplasmic chaperone [Pseudomonas syringae]MCF5118726.1 fimbria/pilus periplasmic chaperone [Pseudomonas syringae]MCF5381644.1 fimbria/pilus periplasmic chaperone [Pseudomonas syringae]